MRTISPLDLRRSLGSILDETSAGQRFLIERDHRPVAMLVSVEDGRRLEDPPEERRERAIAALDRLQALGDAVRARSAAVPSAVDAIREERDRDG
jgi:antitoxin (DNA-binding transcriptional repressor) of toxin-antitoxin stability system